MFLVQWIGKVYGKQVVARFPAPPLPGDVLENEVVIVGPFSSFPLRFRHPFTALVTAEQRVSSALPDE